MWHMCVAWKLPWLQLSKCFGVLQLGGYKSSEKNKAKRSIYIFFKTKSKATFLHLAQKTPCLFQRLCEKPRDTVTRHFASSNRFQKERPRLLFGGKGRTISSDGNHGGWWMMACRVYRCLFWKNPRNRKVDICEPNESVTFETNISESWDYVVVSRCFKHVANTFNSHPCEIQHGKTHITPIFWPWNWSRTFLGVSRIAGLEKHFGDFHSKINALFFRDLPGGGFLNPCDSMWALHLVIWGWSHLPIHPKNERMSTETFFFALKFHLPT